MPNALASETSPYLLQHKDNPVDWMAWGPEALARARELERPLLVSIGYSACHWCHVMEHECFEDVAVAELMNANFVCVKVDREERPDIDALYMEAVQAMTGQGGWPLNVFLTPEQVPFFGGTYFPPVARPGMTSWPDILRAVARAWGDDAEEIRAGGEEVVERLRAGARLTPSDRELDDGLPGDAVAALQSSFDSVNGGFGDAPKFPPSTVLEFLLARAALTGGTETAEARMALQTLRSMAGGGIHDQVGGGFARYSVDARWTVPHFEKMLYDNALLARAYLHGWKVSGDDVLLRTCRETLDWALAEMRAPEGGFYSALDADSEGEEGRFYVWTAAQLREVLGPLAGEALAWLGATERGNFSEHGQPAGLNVLESRGPEPDAKTRDEIRSALSDARGSRVRPALDDKCLTSWNALMIAALAEAGAVLSGDGDAYLAAARDCAEFVAEHLRDGDGRLLRTWRAGRAQLPAYLEDHAFLLEGLLTLYEATFEERWFLASRALGDEIIERFGDPDAGGFFSTASDHEKLVARRKDLEDTPIPSGSSSATLGLLRLAALTGEHRYTDTALRAIALVQEIAPRHPIAFGHMLQAMQLATITVSEVALVGDDLAELVSVVRRAHRPATVLAGAGPGAHSEVPLLAGRDAVDGRATAYVCENFACRMPVTSASELAELLGA